MRHRVTITIPKSRATLISEALTREEAVRLHRENEAEILDAQPLPEPPLPVYQREKVNWGQVILQAFNLKQLLP